MATTPPTPPPGNAPSADDSLLNELVSLTGLFNPERIWQEEETLDDMDEQERARSKPATDTPPLLPAD